MKSLNKVRDSLARKYSKSEADNSAIKTNLDYQAFIAGFDTALSELSKGVGKLDEFEVNIGFELERQKIIEGNERRIVVLWDAFLAGARWQFKQDLARIGLAENRANANASIAKEYDLTAEILAKDVESRCWKLESENNKLEARLDNLLKRQGRK